MMTTTTTQPRDNTSRVTGKPDAANGLALVRGRADITLGSRFGGNSHPGALLWHQSFGNRLAAGLIRLLYGVKISDLGPFRAGRADVLRALALEETTYGWAVEMIVKGATAGSRIVEVPVSYYPRIGKSKISGTLKGHGRSSVVHPEPYRALLFPASKHGNAATGVSPDRPISHGIRKPDRCVSFFSKPHVGHYGESSKARHG